jgi:tetratricopeptide (TPR) repeat protein/AAA+ ATPase superfamily predicted ATPase
MLNRVQNFQRMVPVGSHVKIFLKSGHILVGRLLQIAIDHIILEKAKGGSIAAYFDAIDVWETLTDGEVTPDSTFGASLHQSVLIQKPEQNLILLPKPEQTIDDGPLEAEKILVDEQQPVEISSMSGVTPAIPAFEQHTSFQEDSHYDQEFPEVNESVQREAEQIKVRDMSASIEQVVPDRAKQVDTIKEETWQQLRQLEADFREKIQHVSLEILPPNFALPQDIVASRKDMNHWTRIKECYMYAEQMNELGPHGDKIHLLIKDIRDLEKRYSSSLEIKRHLAYFYWLAQKPRQALKSYREASSAVQEIEDFHNVAVLSYKVGDIVSAYSTLEDLFHLSSICEDSDIWYVFLLLLQKAHSYQPLHKLWEMANLDTKERVLILQTLLYLLLTLEKLQEAYDFYTLILNGTPTQAEIRDIFHQILNEGEKIEPQEENSTIGFERRKEENTMKRVTVVQPEIEPRGWVYSYKEDKGYGFVRTAQQVDYFLSRQIITDTDLLDRLKNWRGQHKNPIPVMFESKPKGASGKAAEITLIYLHRPIDQLVTFAHSCAQTGDLSLAIAVIKQVITYAPDYQEARAILEKWTKLEEESSIKGRMSFFRRAKRANSPEEALRFYFLAIKYHDYFDSAVKDAAQLLAKIDRGPEAIEVLLTNRGRIKDQQRLDNLLTNLYMKIGDYDKALELLFKKAEEKRSIETLREIATCYIRKENYAMGEAMLKEILDQVLDQQPYQKQLVVCLLQQQKYTEAEQILQNMLAATPDDSKAKSLLERTKEARINGLSALLHEQLLENIDDADMSSQISNFARFFLDHCDFKGVSPTKVQEQHFDNSDLKRLEALADQAGTRAPNERAEFYLSAASILFLTRDLNDYNQFYKFLYRSFASFGDAAFSDATFEKKHIDTVRSWYSEALNVYSIDQGSDIHKDDRDDKDALRMLVRYIYLSLGMQSFPNQTGTSIEKALEEVLNQGIAQKVLDDIAYLTLRSRLKKNHILKYFYEEITLRQFVLLYMSARLNKTSSEIDTYETFVKHWDMLLKQFHKDEETVSTNIRLIGNLEFSLSWIEQALPRLKSTKDRLILKLEQQRIDRIQNILDGALSFCKEVGFEPRVYFCNQIDMHCQDLLDDILRNPTKLSIELFYPVVRQLQQTTQSKLKEIHDLSTPQITLTLPLDSYPDMGKKITIQIAVENALRCSPAESVELVVVEEEKSPFTILAKTSLGSSLSGGDRKIVMIPIQITARKRLQAFSLPIFAQYVTRAREIKKTPVERFSIRLYAEQEFEPIHNPYRRFVNSGVVDDQQMFYGRSELIEKVASSIHEAGKRSKSIIIYGQKRAGKSSILYHLKKQLASENGLLILEPSLGSIIDEHVPFVYQFLWDILTQLKWSLKEEVDKGRSALPINFISAQEFYNHPSPQTVFNDTFRMFRYLVDRDLAWRDTRIVLMIDEFQYIYDQIVRNRLSVDFMKMWKALLGANFFSAVLVGQDVMTKFKQDFPNEFGTTEDERVTYLKRVDAEKLIDEPIRINGKDGESRYKEQAIKRILELTAGSPFYIQIVCYRLVEYMNRERIKYITEADVDQIKSDLIHGEDALGSDKFDNLINSGDTSKNAISSDDALNVMKAIAIHSQTKPCNKSLITCSTKTELENILDDLENRDVIKKTSKENYTLRVGLFKEWLIIHQ